MTWPGPLSPGPLLNTLFIRPMAHITMNIINNVIMITWTQSRRKKLNWEENPVRDLPGRSAITITTGNNNDASQYYTLEIYRQIQTS